MSKSTKSSSPSNVRAMRPSSLTNFSILSSFLLTVILLCLYAEASQPQHLQVPKDSTTPPLFSPETPFELQDEDESHANFHAFSKPAAVRKMGVDEGEKFFMEFWRFEGFDEQDQGAMSLPHDSQRPTTGQDESAPLSHRFRSVRANHVEVEDFANGSIILPYRAPFVLHTDGESSMNPLSGRSLSDFAWSFFRSPAASHKRVVKRDFRCPPDTSSCSSIERPNSCCAPGDTCEVIEDTGLGDVGCCSRSRGCAGEVVDCDNGLTECPGSMGGGCCLPGYVCVGVGCAPSSSSTLTPSSSTASADAPTSTSPSTSTTTTTTSVPSSSAAASSTDTPEPEPEPTNTAAFIPPVRPTSVAASTSTSPLATAAGCPTGFYQCAANYRGGCCRIGRDCGETSCPASAYSTVQGGNGANVLVPTGTLDLDAPAGALSGNPGEKVNAAATTASGSSTTPAAEGTGGTCAEGWYLCAASVGGACCPTGFSCRTEDCRAQPTGSSPTGAEVGKIAASGAAISVVRRMETVVAAAVAALAVSCLSSLY
ncbi:MAG: hypothetical protein M1833_005931 [Piccolia ochrophora]|nr:MAG: hypothetical protein M1833_005931 [Piccolia ochrophora]